ncbi:hypothetical protein FK531_14415 [Rhodococcus spelaei]|uniref:Uncharacterized protein n=1 Tax=Rhodococcus spelaei TaxID=2546320 RepID=A0A541B7J1_9NOCA|nr:hypothetical protein FK531_14415 [Rhodococcus spelaei]
MWRRRALVSSTAHKARVATSATTLIATCGEGSQPRSVNPNRPTERDKANAASAPADSNAATARSHHGPPSNTSTATANDTAACSRNDGPMTWTYR